LQFTKLDNLCYRRGSISWVDCDRKTWRPCYIKRFFHGN